MKPSLLKIHFLFLFFILLTSSSCIKFDGADEGVLYYRLLNHSGYRIKIVAYDFWDHKYYFKNTSDSTIYFNAGEERDLLVVYGVGYWRSEPEHMDTLQGIHVLKICKNDTVPVTKNYRLRKYWVYSEPDKYKHEYTLEITDESFIP